MSKITPLPKGVKQTNAGQSCDMLDGPCSCGAWHKNKSMPIEEKIRHLINKIRTDLDILDLVLSIYIGENQIARGDVFSHKEVLAKIKRKYGKRLAK